jgi:nucleoside-diphosphate-sugar epimerase
MKVVVLGGYGYFGASIARTLAAAPGFEVIVAGRDGAQGRGGRAIDRRARTARGRDRSLPARTPVEARAASGDQHRRPVPAARPRVGTRGHRGGSHYVDLADSREFVGAITALDAAARRATCSW